MKKKEILTIEVESEILRLELKNSEGPIYREKMALALASTIRENRINARDVDIKASFAKQGKIVFNKARTSADVEFNIFIKLNNGNEIIENRLYKIW